MKSSHVPAGKSESLITTEPSHHEGPDSDTENLNATSLNGSDDVKELLKLNRLQFRVLMGLFLLLITYTSMLAQKLLIPLAFAFLLSLVLTPAVRLLERARIPRTIGAAVIVLLLLTGVTSAISGSIDPISDWLAEAPSVLKKLERKATPLKKTVEEVNKTAAQVDRLASVNDSESVEVKMKEISIRDTLYSNAQGLAAGILLSTFLLYFLLSWGKVTLTRIGWLLAEGRQRDRFLELSLALETEVSKYMATITVINTSLGVVVGASLYLAGMPNPVVWGIVAATLNFIPYFGALATGLLIGMTALLNFEGLSTPLIIMTSFALITIIEGQIVTPLVLGQRLALNPMIVFLSVVFWFWLWGVAGALMAVPLLITFKLIGGRVPIFRPIAIIAGR